MKKILAFILIVSCLFFSPSLWAAGSCVQSVDYAPGGFIVVDFACTGDAANGTIQNTAVATTTMAVLTGALKYYLYTVSAFPTAGGTAPDAADVFVLDADGEDLLGSIDGGTTANKGLNLIHATLKKTAFPYSHHMSNSYAPPVTNTHTLKVSGQTTISANFTVRFVYAP
jgi:hypothetical protein